MNSKFFNQTHQYKREGNAARDAPLKRSIFFNSKILNFKTLTTGLFTTRVHGRVTLAVSSLVSTDTPVLNLLLMLLLLLLFLLILLLVRTQTRPMGNDIHCSVFGRQRVLRRMH